MELWLLLGLGGAVSSLVFGWDRSLALFQDDELLDQEQELIDSEEQAVEVQPEGPFELSELVDFASGGGDDEIYVTAQSDGSDGWTYAKRSDLETMLDGEDVMAWFYEGDDHSDPDTGHDTAEDCEDLIHVASGAGDDWIEVWGHAASEIRTGEGADTVLVCDGAGYTVVHVEDEDTAILCDDWTGYVIGTGSASVIGGAGVDVIRMTGDSSGSNVQAGAGADDLVTGGGGILNGNQGDDSLTANGDNAILRGGSGNDHITSYGSNTIIGGAGKDTVTLGDDMVSHSYMGDDMGVTTYTRIADVTLGGNGAIDQVQGNDGADLIEFIDAGDTVSGGNGVDTFTAIAGDEASVITDFHPGQETLRIYETGGAMITHGTGTLIGELSDAELDSAMQAEPSYDLSGRVTSAYDEESCTTRVLIDGEPAVILEGCTWATIGYVNGGDDTVYGLDGQPLAEGLRANVIVEVHENITQISQIG
ncbi:calcium-binding protein [Donghicola sp. XS_ASV15]|uniref:calcium-binding protein n=1 Tax=Donghicola sp. XS_ASV15 TaxID=3241295 RepID=UPI0035125982